MEKTKATSANRPNGQEKSVTSQSPNPFDAAAIRMYTIKRLLQRRNALARYVGTPCVLRPDRIRPYPAILHEYGMRSKGFGGYRIQLAPFNGIFKQVKFRGKGNGNDVVSGYIIDKQGGIESFALSPDTPDLFYNQFYATQRVKSFKAAFYNAKIEILSLNNSGNDNIMFTPYDGTSLSHAFILCKQLKAIIGILDARNISVGDAKNIGSGCDSLIYAKIFGIKGDFILFNTSKNISKESILYTIQNATPSSAITITLHTDAYSRLADDADILAALAAQPFVSLVSA